MATTFDNELLNVFYTSEADGGPGHGTANPRSGAGGAIQHPNVNLEDYIGEWDINYQNMRDTKRDDLRQFHILRNGMARGFRFLAPDADTLEFETVGVYNDADGWIKRLSATDGNTRIFYFIKFYSSPSNNYLRWILKPSPLNDLYIYIYNTVDPSNYLVAKKIPGTFVNTPFEEIPESRSVDLGAPFGKCTFFYSKGRLEFESNVPANHVIQISCTYHHPAAFLQDRPIFSKDVDNNSNLSVSLREILPKELGLSPDDVSLGDVAPEVSFTLPAEKSGYKGTMNFEANASDDIAVTDVGYFLDGERVGNNIAAAPYAISIDTDQLTEGTHELVAQARDADKNTGIDVFEFVVDRTVPTVGFTADSAEPPGGYSGTIGFTATATDNFEFNRVEFFLDSVYQTYDDSDPYQYALDTTALANDDYTVSAISFDTAGNQSNPVFIEITVNN